MRGFLAAEAIDYTIRGSSSTVSGEKPVDAFFLRAFHDARGFSQWILKRNAGEYTGAEGYTPPGAIW